MIAHRVFFLFILGDKYTGPEMFFRLLKETIRVLKDPGKFPFFMFILQIFDEEDSLRIRTISDPVLVWKTEAIFQLNFMEGTASPLICFSGSWIFFKRTVIFAQLIEIEKSERLLIGHVRNSCLGGAPKISEKAAQIR